MFIYRPNAVPSAPPAVLNPLVANGPPSVVVAHPISVSGMLFVEGRVSESGREYLSPEERDSIPMAQLAFVQPQERGLGGGGGGERMQQQQQQKMKK